jgi:hypothetical protein
MKFYKAMFAATVVLTLGMSGYASAQFGGLKVPGLGGGSSSGAVDIDTYLRESEIATTLMRRSVDQLARALATKEQIAEIEALKKQAAETTNDKEKAAKQDELQKSEAAMLNSKDFDQVASDQAKSKDLEKKKQLAGSAFNFLLAFIKDKELLEQSQPTIKAASGNPATLSKLGKIKDITASISTQLQLFPTLVTKVPKIFQAVGVKNPPSKASDAPMDVAD